jgi:hypothetical protein
LQALGAASMLVTAALERLLQALGAASMLVTAASGRTVTSHSSTQAGGRKVVVESVKILFAWKDRKLLGL